MYSLEILLDDKLQHVETAAAEAAALPQDLTAGPRLDVKLIQMVLQAKMEWQLTIDTLPYPMVLADPAGRIVRANLATAGGDSERIRRIPGTMVSDIVRTHGRQTGELGCMLRSRFRDCRFLAPRENTAGGHTRRLAGEAPPPEDWGPFYEAAELFTWPVMDGEGRVSRLVHYLVDQTEIWKLEQQLIENGRMSTIGMLASGMAHNLNNPLQALYGQIQLLDMRFETREETAERDSGIACDVTQHSGDAERDKGERGRAEEARVALKRSEVLNMLDQVEEMRGIVQSLLIKLRSEHCQELQPVDVNALLERELRLLDANLQYKHEVRKSVDFDPELEPVVAVYSDVSQGIMNIVNNALDSMHASEDKVLTVATEHAAEGMNRLRVRDTGCGIPEELRDEIFQPFFSTKPSLAERENDEPTGTGLGMSSTCYLLGKYGIEIEYQSEVGEGTEFVLSWHGLNENV